MEAVKNPNSPKIVVDNQGFAMYFSRSIIPYVRGKEEEEWLKSFPYLKHLGIYAYRKEVLKEVTKLPQSSLEIAREPGTASMATEWLQDKSWYYRCRNCRHRHARRFAAGRRIFEKQKVIKKHHILLKYRRMNKIENIVKRYIFTTVCSEWQTPYIVALSGGADSVALLLILKNLGLNITAAHCNFHLRGERESDRDEQFCVNLCQQQGISLLESILSTHAYAHLHKVHLEMAARDLRYRYFAQLVKDLHAGGICAGPSSR